MTDPIRLHRPYPPSHTTQCSVRCRRKATCHIGWGSGCGNVCDSHRAAILRCNPGARISAPIIEGRE